MEIDCVYDVALSRCMADFVPYFCICIFPNTKMDMLDWLGAWVVSVHTRSFAMQARVHDFVQYRAAQPLRRS